MCDPSLAYLVWFHSRSGVARCEPYVPSSDWALRAKPTRERQSWTLPGQHHSTPFNTKDQVPKPTPWEALAGSRVLWVIVFHHALSTPSLSACLSSSRHNFLMSPCYCRRRPTLSRKEEEDEEDHPPPTRPAPKKDGETFGVLEKY